MMTELPIIGTRAPPFPKRAPFQHTCRIQELPIIVRTPDFEYAITDRMRAYNRSYWHNFSDLPSVVALARSVQARRERCMPMRDAAVATRPAHTSVHTSAHTVQARRLCAVRARMHVPPQWGRLLHPSLYNVFLLASKV